MAEPEIVGEVILYQNKCFKKVRRWLKGIHTKLRVIIRGITGWETVQETSVVQGATFEVIHYFKSVA